MNRVATKNFPLWLRLHPVSQVPSCWNSQRRITVVSYMLSIVLVIFNAASSTLAHLQHFQPIYYSIRVLLICCYCIYFRFYTEALGMKLLRHRDVPEEKYSNAFLGFGPEESNFAVELTYSMFLNIKSNSIIFVFRVHDGYFHVC